MEKCVTLILFAFLGGVFSQNEGLFALNIIHYNDFHAHFDEVSPQGTPCNPTEDPCVGGIARLHTAINEVLEDEPDSLLLNGGDTFQGTIWYNFLRWNVTTFFMNALPKHDAHVLGNHEFDNGIEGLTPYLEGLDAVMLGANVNSTYEPTMQELYQNHVVVERHGRRIGIIGVLLQTFSAPIGNLIIEDEVEAVNREARILTAQGVDIIIVLSHCGLESDRRMAAAVVPEVDIIVGAHSHSLLYNGETPSGDNPAAPYPTIVTQTNGHTIPIVQASAYTRYLGNIKLYINDAGIVESWEGQPIYLGTSIVQDPLILSLLEPWREQVDAFGKEVLGDSRVTLSNQCRSSECNLGSWACDGLLQQLMHLADNSTWNYAHACLINAGGIRTQIIPGQVTTEALLMAIPFENMVQSYDLQGRYLLEALEFSVSGDIDPNNFNSGRMVQVGGVRVVYDARAPEGSRVVQALVRCIDCAVPRYEPLDLHKTYRLVTQNYIGDGGSGFTMLAEHRENVQVHDVDYVMLQGYMRYQHTVLQDLDGRIQILA